MKFWFANVHVFFTELLKMSSDIPLNINIKEPRWDQSTFVGRANHFFTVTDPRNILLSDAQLENARKIVHDYRYDIGYIYWGPKKVCIKSTWLYMSKEIFKALHSLHCSLFLFQSLKQLGYFKLIHWWIGTLYHQRTLIRCSEIHVPNSEGLNMITEL